MPIEISRRGFFGLAAGAGTLAALRAQVAAPGTPPLQFKELKQRSTVALLKGDQRRKLIADALTAIDDQVRPALRKKKYVVIKPNNVSTVNQLAATQADTILGIMDYLEPRFKG